MYSKLLILSLILCANSLFAQSNRENDKLQRILNEDKRSQIKNRQELLNWIFSTSPTAGTTTNSPSLQSRSMPNTKSNPSNVKLASDQPMEEKKIEVSKDIPKISNQGQ